MQDPPTQSLELPIDAQAPDVLIARQAIFDRALTVIGYELLCRNGGGAGVTDGNTATASVITGGFAEIGLRELVGSGLAFINLTRDWILSHDNLPFSHTRVVLEVLEDITVDDALLAALHALRARGATVALDDYVYREDTAALLPLADIVKIDVLAHTTEEVEALVARLRRHQCKLVAEKVETPEQFEWCKALGFDYFQGYFLCHPKLVTARSLAVNRLSLIELLQCLYAPDMDVQALVAIIDRDPSLTYKLLRAVNSASYGLPRRVDSIREAVVLLGTETLRNWAALIAMSRVDDKPVELMTMAVLRAAMAEELARRLGHVGTGAFFTVGLFSLLDAIMDAPLEALVEALPVSESVSGALLRREGTMGEVLGNVLAYEHGDWASLDDSRLPRSELRDAYLQATAFAGCFRDNLN
ncbi:EAL and HDOD domain-containing protein [Arhodomonas sp. AD133]|uniref:EAL and HDOD domain-containing protein n=1 Tax=Arhodomonas sp. AD133 TaxID=3415009 RepID=UPI003EBBE7DB